MQQTEKYWNSALNFLTDFTDSKKYAFHCGQCNTFFFYPKTADKKICPYCGKELTFLDCGQETFQTLTPEEKEIILKSAQIRQQNKTMPVQEKPKDQNTEQKSAHYPKYACLLLGAIAVLYVIDEIL